MMRDPEERLAELAYAARAGRNALRCRIEWQGVGYPTYTAGQRRGKIRFGPFGRDLLVSALLLGEPEFSRDALRFVAAAMGRRTDASSGEEPGRGIDELRDVVLRGRSTRCNALEVSPLFVIVADLYAEMVRDEATLLEIQGALRAAFNFVTRHMMRNGLFVEDAALCGGTRYALRSMYWKDSFLPVRDDPVYPVSYTLAHVQGIAALRSACSLSWRLGESWDLGIDALTTEAIEKLASQLWDPDAGRPWIAVDQRGPTGGASLDALHMLVFLSAGDLPASCVKRIEQQAEDRATPYGFRTYAPGQLHYDNYTYHYSSVWPFEQVIAQGADRHGLRLLLEVSFRIVDALEEVGFVELSCWNAQLGLEGPGAGADPGYDLELWTTCVPSALQ